MTNKVKLGVDDTIEALNSLSTILKKLRRRARTIIAMQQRGEYNSPERTEIESQYDKLLQSQELMYALKSIYLKIDAYLAVDHIGIKGGQARRDKIIGATPDLDCITHDFS